MSTVRENTSKEDRLDRLFDRAFNFMLLVGTIVVIFLYREEIIAAAVGMLDAFTSSCVDVVDTRGGCAFSPRR